MCSIFLSVHFIKYLQFLHLSTHSNCAATTTTHHARPAAATLASSPPTCAIQDHRLLVYKALHDLLPVYLAEDCQLVSVTALTGRRQVRSSDIDTCLAQRTKTRLGDRSFAATRPRIWNSLSTQLREWDITTLHSENFDEHSKRIYLVTDSYSAE